ncbi:MAG: hypothetical protein COA66_13995 [Arcobacter sp.]|nr:MAG: hypothetical protein COA66_13995 [Arcobacter sp.]
MKKLLIFLFFSLSLFSSTHKYIDFSEDEKIWLKKNTIIKLAVIDYWDRDNDNNNIHTELIRLLSHYGNINIIPLSFDTWNAAYNDALKGESSHGIMHLSWIEERKKNYFHYSMPYDAKANFLVVRKGNRDINSIEDLKNKHVYVQKNAITQTILENYSSKINLIEHTNNDKMLKLLSTNKRINAVFIYNVKKEQLEKYGLRIVKKVYGKYTNKHIGITHQHKELQTIINKIMAIIPPFELNKIQRTVYKKSNNALQKNKLFLTKEEKLWIKKHPIITVGGEKDWAPFDFVDENGKYNGLSKDYLDAISSLTGLNFEIKTGKTWNELLLALKNSQIDMVPAIYYSKKREKFVNFTSSYLSISDYYITKSNYPRIDSITSLYGKTVVAIKGYEVTSWLKEKHPKISLLEVSNLLEALQSLESGESIAFLNDNPSSSYSIEKNFISGLKFNNVVKNRRPLSLHMASKKEYKILSTIINKALKKITKEQKRTIASYWMSEVNHRSIELTKQETLWLSSKPILKFAVDPNWLPIEAINKKSKQYEGMMADILSTISETSGIQFKLVETKEWSKSIELAKNSEVDVLAALSTTDKRKKFLNFSDKTVILSDGVIMQNNSTFITSLNGLKGLRIGVSDGTSLHDMLKKDYPNLIIRPIKGIEKGLDKLHKGEIDAFIGNLEVASHIIIKKHFFNLKIVFKLEQTRQLHIGLIKSLPKEALSIINKSLKSISQNEFNTIRQRWIGLKINKEIDYTIFYKIAFAVIVLIIFFIFTNRKLQQLVNKRTQDLQKERDKLSSFNKNLESLVSQRTVLLEDAKNELEESNKLTRDSINYAALIQHALIPEEDAFDIYFKTHFALWSPKDVVGGDIYLFEELRGEHECLLMVIDCTGHGVPGAFVTMLVKAIERQVVSKIVNNEDLEVSPAWILSYFNKSMKKILKQDNKDSLSNAGFDGGILYYNKKQKYIKYAGAETPLFYFEEDELKVIKSDRHSVGYKKSDINYEFTEHTIDVKAGMQFYLSTDGYLDQNGGEKAFPFGKRKFQELLKKVHTLAYEEQKEIFLSTMKEYQGDEIKNDDITMIALKI